MRRLEQFLLVLTIAGVRAWFLGKGRAADARRWIGGAR